MCPLLQRIFLFVAFFSCFGMNDLLHAEEKSAPIPDYKAAHEKFIALGLPVLSASAKWISAPNNRNYSMSVMEITTKGNAWLLENGGQARASYLPWGELSPKNLSAEAAKKLQSASSPSLDADITTMITKLSKIKSEENEIRSMIHYNRGDKEMGKFLIFSAQLRQVGKTDAANALTHAILTFSPAHSERFIDAGISEIADHQYAAINKQFATDHQWKTYADNLRNLLARFPRGWAKRDAVALCLEASVDRAKEKPPAPLDIKDPIFLGLANSLLLPPVASSNQQDGNIINGVDLSKFPESQRARIKEQILMSMDGDFELGGRENGSFRDLWLLSKVDTTESSDAITRIQAMGLASLPSLAAMVEDPTLTHIFTPQDRSSHFSYYGDSEKNAKAIHKSLHRPMSRGEIAVRLLSSTLPNQGDDNSEIPPSDLALQAIDFWKKHKDGNRWDIASAFIEGDEAQQMMAISALAESDDPDAHNLLEKNILKTTRSIQNIVPTILEYLQKNPKADPKFVEEFKNKIRAEATDPESMQRNYFGSEAKRKAYYDGLVKQVENLTNKKSPQEIIAPILTENPEGLESTVRSVMQMLKKKPSSEALLFLLSNAIQAKNPAAISALLEPIHQLEFDYEEEIRPLSQQERKLWKTLLDDQRVVKDENMNEGKDISIAQISASILYYSCLGDKASDAYRWAPVLKVPVEELIQTHAKHLVQGSPLPPWPDAKKVSKERLNEMVNSTEGKTPKEIMVIAEKFSPDETAAWIQWINKPADIPHPAAIVTMRRSIVERGQSYKEIITDDPKVDGLEVGFHLTTESLLTWVENFSKNMEEKSRSSTFIYENPQNQLGLHVESEMINITQEEKDQKSKDRQRMNKISYALELCMEPFSDDETTTAVTVMNIRKNRSDITISWKLSEGKVTHDEVDPKTLKEFLEPSVEEDADDDSEYSEPFTIRLQTLHRKDFDKIMEMYNSNEE